MNLGKLGRQVLVAGAIIIFISAALLGVEWVRHRHYRSENEDAIRALGRELSGDNARARERRKDYLAAGRMGVGAGLIVMLVGGVFMYADAKQRQGA